MNRTELVNAVTASTNVSRSDVEAALVALTEVVERALADRDRVTIPGFVTFEAKHRPARVARNPRTGDPIDVPATWVPKITAGSALKKAVGG